MFLWSQQIGVACSRQRCCVLAVSISNHRLVSCEVFCIWRHVNRLAPPLFNRKQRLSESVVIFSVFCFALFWRTENLFGFFALLVSIDHSHSVSWHRPRKPSQKFKMCDFVASSQAFVAKAGIDCDHWRPSIHCEACMDRNQALLRSW